MRLLNLLNIKILLLHFNIIRSYNYYNLKIPNVGIAVPNNGTKELRNLSDHNKTVLKSMEVLNLFKKYECLALHEMVLHLGMPKSSVHRMARSLEEMGFLQRNEDGSYSLGLLFLEFGHLVSERLNIRRIAYPIMESIKNEIGEAVNLVIADGDEALYIEKVETSERVRVYTQIGRRAPLYGGACPRILLTYLPKEKQEDYLNKVKLIPYGANTITNKQDLVKLLEEDGKRGYTVSHSELEDFSSSVGAPIFNYYGEIIAGISIVGPEARFRNDDHLNKVIACAVKGAKEISKKMGWTENGEPKEKVEL